MIADLQAFGIMDNHTANSELKRNLSEVKRAAELLLNLMDLLIGRIDFEAGESEKFIALRQAILDFRSVEVNPGTPLNIVIDADNMESLERLYGATTEQCKNVIINDMVRDYILKMNKKLKSDYLNEKCQEQKGKLQKALEKIESKNN